MPRVIHFEVSADNPERAIRFYKNVFGWDIKKWKGPTEYWLITTGPADQPGIDGGLARRAGNASWEITIEVPSVDDFVARVEWNGGKVVRPRSAVPGVGYLAYCRDTEGNTFGVMQMDESAK